MSQLSLAATPTANLTGQITLNCWYKIENKHLIATDILPKAHQGVLSVAFGGELSADHLLALTAFLSSHGFTNLTVCCYQPIESMPSAWCVHSDSTSPLSPSVLTAFANQHGLQLVQLTNPPTVNEPGLLLMDMDSTAITIECIDEIARLADVYDEVAAVTAQAMAGQLDFAQSLKQRVAKLEGIDVDLIDDLKSRLPLMPGVNELCQYLKKYDWHLAIASGGFVPFAEQVQSLIGLDEVHANTLEFKDNRLTGKVIGTIVDAEEKARVLKRIAEKLTLNTRQTVAMGDGANDLKMMSAAGLGVAVHGKPKVVEQAQTAINEGSLLQVSYLLTIPLDYTL
ncbi:phosphoserine phosphatase SerB [Pseudoalteromonas lipolytica]|uniref:phosphoserine phosphatase SerB n=1 Tax=Pseudoalteromonas lipolytica TaxID=570156 RepID=UPI00082475EB|nr:phosphoserine phosphatase SerB [Pseudoalteromonas lipolytica]